MWTGVIEVEDMRGIPLATALGCVRGLIYVEPKVVLPATVSHPTI